jgi:YgiT-type zinc finger domain-containing protein
MKKGRTAYSINRKNYHLVIENVPAFVCQQCGEPYFEGEEVDAIQDLINDIDERIEKEGVGVTS